MFSSHLISSKMCLQPLGCFIRLSRGLPGAVKGMSFWPHVLFSSHLFHDVFTATWLLDTAVSRSPGGCHRDFLSAISHPGLQYALLENIHGFYHLTGGVFLTSTIIGLMPKPNKFQCSSPSIFSPLGGCTPPGGPRDTCAGPCLAFGLLLQTVLVGGQHGGGHRDRISYPNPASALGSPGSLYAQVHHMPLSLSLPLLHM